MLTRRNLQSNKSPYHKERKKIHHLKTVQMFLKKGRKKYFKNLNFILLYE